MMPSTKKQIEMKSEKAMKGSGKLKVPLTIHVAKKARISLKPQSKICSKEDGSGDGD